MVRLVAKGDPDIVCLQELPVWALERLEAWSGMRAFTAVTMPALGGRLGRRVTELDPRRVRSALSGQANAILLNPAFAIPDEQTRCRLNPAMFRRTEAARLGLPVSTRLAWGRNRRVVQAVRIADQGSSALVANVHLTSSTDSRLADAELMRAVGFVGQLGEADGGLLLCGDLNLTSASSVALRGLARDGFSAPGPGIDHILGLGLTPARGPEPWPERRRRLGDVLLSDHAPVEAEMIRP
jgi:endonuclease/exonuclease/phosphatase family metal-dependent hydrolase